MGITLRANLVISALKRTHVVYNKPRLRWVMTVMRMMHSEIDSPRIRTFCSRRHVSSSIGISQWPFGNRRAVSCMSNSNAIRARHSSLISISGIGLAESRRAALGWPPVEPHGPDQGKIRQLNRSNEVGESLNAIMVELRNRDLL